MNRGDSITNSTGPQKVLVIGLDGGTWDVLDPLIVSGYMPNLAELRASGSYGGLRTTLPPVTGSAWISFMTDKNPGRHGVFDFWALSGEGLDVRPAPSLASGTLWSVLSQAGKRVIVINVPMTYPPRPVNGVMVAGMMALDNDTRITFPADVYTDMVKYAGPYAVDLQLRRNSQRLNEFFADYFSNGYRAFLDELFALNEKRQRASLYLMREQAWDFCMVTLVGLDRLQHYMWPYVVGCVDTEGPSTATVRERVLEYFRQIDDVIGSFVAAAGEHATVVLVSDHGFGLLKKQVYLNAWLRDTGYLVPRRAGKSVARLRALMRRLGLSTWRLGNKLGIRRLSRLRALDASLDWARTYAYQRFTNSIYINLKGRNPYGIVEPGHEYEAIRNELSARLKALRDPDDGTPIVRHVYRKEEAYSGHFLAQAPDLIIEFEDGYTAYKNDFVGQETFARDPWKTGDHRMDGVWLVSGACVQRCDRSLEASIVDLMPTILYLLDVPIPEDVNGNVLAAALDPNLLTIRPPRQGKETPVVSGDVDVFDDEAKELIRERLQGLGYLD